MEGGLFGAWAGLARLAALPGVGAVGFFGCALWRSSCWRSCRTCSGVRALMLLRSWLKSVCVIAPLRIMISSSFFYLDYHDQGRLPIPSGIFSEKREAGQVRYWQYGQAENSPDLAISDLTRFLLPACLRVFHLALEHVFLAQRHGDCRRAEF